MFAVTAVSIKREIRHLKKIRVHLRLSVVLFGCDPEGGLEAAGLDCRRKSTLSHDREGVAAAGLRDAGAAS